MEDKLIDTPAHISERLNHAIKVTKISQSEIARKCGYTRVYINQLVRGKRAEYTKPTALQKIANVLGVNPIWLLYGEGDMFSSVLGYAKGICFDLDENFPVRIYQTDAIQFTEDNEVIWGRSENTAFVPSQLINNKEGILNGVVVASQTMSPSLCDGDLAIIDITQRNIVDGYLYAFIYEGNLNFRRIIVNIDGSFTFINEYPVKSTMTISANELSKYCILGRVVCKISNSI